MPISKSSVTEKPKDNKQMLLELISNKFGLNNAVIMEKALKTQDKQIEQAMMEGGMTADQIGQTRGVNLGLLDQLLQQNIPSSGVKATGEQTPRQSESQTSSLQLPPGTIKPATSIFGMGGWSQDAQGNLVYTQRGAFQKAALGDNNDLGDLIKTKLASDAKKTQLNGLADLPPDQQVAAYALARKIAGVRGAVNILPSIITSLQLGKSIDQIEDELRYMGQSPEFAEVRDAAQSILVDKGESQRNVANDALDDYIQRGDKEGAKSYLKRMAIKSSPAEQQNKIMGKERTVQFLQEIQTDLDTLEKNGINTGFFSGNWENLIARVGQVKSPEMRKIATKIAVAMMNYRRDMTGVQFGREEAKEYKALFPSINKIGLFNKSSITGLQEAFSGDLGKFYSLSMGEGNYKKLFGDSGNNDNSILNRLGLDPNKYEIVR